MLLVGPLKVAGASTLIGCAVGGRGWIIGWILICFLALWDWLVVDLVAFRFGVGFS